MQVFRIAHKLYANSLEASGLEGRWNSKGNKVTYAAGSISLAILENLFYRRGTGFNAEYRIIIIEIPDKLPMLILNAKDLKAGWNDTTKFLVSRKVGDDWYNNQKTTVLQVPSSIVPEEYNFVLNTMHPDFSKIVLVKKINYLPDARIESILKNLRK